jgi:hypothetical protein
VLSKADASPATASSTVASAALVIDTNAKPAPTWSRMRTGGTLGYVAACTNPWASATLLGGGKGEPDGGQPGGPWVGIPLLARAVAMPSPAAGGR